MSVKVSAAAGNLSVGANWVGGVKPGPTDRMRILHAIVVDEDTIVGSSLGTNIAATGTVTCSGQNLVGTGTLFTTELVVGDTITVAGSLRTVQTITDDTHITLVGNLTQVAAVAYTYRPMAVYVAGNSTAPVTTPSTTGKLTVAAGFTLTVRGDMNLLKTQLILGGAGTKVLLDSSIAAGTPPYWIDPGAGQGGGSNGSAILGGGTSRTAMATLGIAPGSGIGRIVGSNNCAISLSYTDLSTLGSSVSDAVTITVLPANNAVSFQYCAFPLARISATNIGLAANSAVDFCWHPDTAAGLCIDVLNLGCAAGTATGTRSLTYNQFAVPDGELHVILSGTSSIYTTTGTIFNRLDTQAGTSNPLVNAADNLFYIRQVATPAGTLWSFYGNAGDTITRPVVINDEGPAQVNEHQMMPVDVINQAGTWKTVDEVFERIGPVGTTPGRDITHPSGGPGNVTAAFIHRMEGLVVLPDCTGRAPGAYRGRGDTNTKMQIVHSTIPTDMTPVANSDFYGAVTIGSEYAGLAGMLDENQSNLFYASAGFPGLFANAGFGTAYTTAHTVPSGANVADVMNVAKYGHNAHFNGKNGTVYDAAGANGLTVLGLHGLWLSVRNIVAGKWSTDVDLGTGADLQAAGPKFVDPTRCIATFDTAYLGNTAPAWAPTTVYAFGDIRSCSSAAFYGGVTVNFRCIKGHTSASSATADPYTGQPGNSTTNIATIPGGGTRGGFREYWELAGVYRIRAAQKAGALTTDATLGLTAVPLQRAYHAWVRAGRAPQAAALNLAAHDGTTIGAMAYVAPLIVSAFTLPLVLAHKIAAKFGKTFSSLFNY